MKSFFIHFFIFFILTILKDNCQASQVKRRAFIDTINVCRNLPCYETLFVDYKSKTNIFKKYNVLNKNLINKNKFFSPSILSKYKRSSTKKSSVWKKQSFDFNNLYKRMYTTGTYSHSSLSIKNLSYSFGNKQVLEGVNLTLSKGERVTIVGENGVGKSTLLRLIAGQINNFEGIIQSPTTIGYLPQFSENFKNTLVLEHLIKTSSNPIWAEHLKTYPYGNQSHDKWFQEFNNLGGYIIHRSLYKLGMNHNILKRPLNKLSSGERTKIYLYALINQNPDLLLLDEPTNHLDLQSIKWLEKNLISFKGSVLMVTHDRTLINKTTTKISELSPIDHNLHHFIGGYESYLKQQEKIHQKLVQRRKIQDLNIKNISNRLSKIIHQPRSIKIASDSDKLNYNARGERKQKGLGRLKNILNNKINILQNNLVEIPKLRKKIQIEFDASLNSNFTLTANNVAYSTLDRQLFSNISFSLKSGEKLCITGMNGVGKTTLLKIIAGLIKPQHGNVSYSKDIKLGFLDQNQESINLNKKPIEIIMENADLCCDEYSAYKILNNFAVNYEKDIDLPLQKLSIGTRRKVQLASIIASKANVLLLDEPTNHLDIMSLEKIEEQLDIFHGIIIAVSHDRYFMNKIGAKELKIGDEYNRYL